MGVTGQRTPPRTPEPASAEADQSYRPPGAEPPAPSPADAAAAAAIHGAPAAHPTRANAGAARAEEHGAPAPSARMAPKLWAIAALVALAVAGALAFG